MTRSRPARAALAAAAVLAASSPALAQEAQRYTLAGDAVRIYNLVGTIRLEGGSGSEVVVEVTRRGPDAAKLDVRTGRDDGAATLAVRYPADRVVWRDGMGRGSYTTVRVDDEGRFGDVQGGRRVRVMGSGDGLEASADVRVMVPAGRRVRVYLAAGEASARGVQGDLHLDVQSADVTVERHRGALSLDTGSGDVTVRGLEGSLSHDAGSGAADLEGVRGQVVELDTGSGSVTARDVTATRLIVDSGSGRIRLSEVRAPDISLDTGSGSVELDLLSDVERLEIDSGSGGIRVAVPEELGAEIEASVGSGGIDVDVPVEGMRRTRDSLSGRIGDGQGRIVIDSGSGRIRIVRR